MNKGYIYCLSNKTYNDGSTPLFKIGSTSKTPDIRAKELYNTSVPTPFKVEFAKKVEDYEDCEKRLHKHFNDDRYNDTREFFKTPLEEIRKIFNIIRGEEWEQEEVLQVLTQGGSSRDMSKYFTNGQRIRHFYRKQDDTWIGYYDASRDKIIYEEQLFDTLSGFARAHYKFMGIDRKVNGWTECKCEKNEKWVSIEPINTLEI